MYVNAELLRSNGSAASRLVPVVSFRVVVNEPFVLEDPLLTVADVTGALGLNQQTVRNYVDAGVLPAVRVGGRRVRIRRSALDAFLKAGETPDLVVGVASLDEARRRLAAPIKSNEALADEQRAELAEALGVLEDVREKFANLLDEADR